MKREGWAASVGLVYLTRDGREVKIQNYSVALWDGVLGVDLVGILLDAEQKAEGSDAISVLCMIDFDEQGNYVGGGPEGTEPPKPQHPLDLVEAKLPAGSVVVRSAPGDERAAK